MIRRVLTLVVLLSFVLLAGVFASVNTQPISVDLLVAQYELPQSLVIIGALACGAVIGLLCASLFLLRYYTDRRRLRKQLRLAEAEISSLRSLPLHDAD
ncbi:MAG: LapA family protein [Pseudomonadota bacterium]